MSVSGRTEGGLVPECSKELFRDQDLDFDAAWRGHEQEHTFHWSPVSETVCME